MHRQAEYGALEHADQQARLESHLSSRLGEPAEIVHIERIARGQSRAMYILELGAEKRRKLVLRVEQWGLLGTDSRVWLPSRGSGHTRHEAHEEQYAEPWCRKKERRHVSIMSEARHHRQKSGGKVATHGGPAVSSHLITQREIVCST